MQDVDVEGSITSIVATGGDEMKKRTDAFSCFFFLGFGEAEKEFGKTARATKTRAVGRFQTS